MSEDIPPLSPGEAYLRAFGRTLEHSLIAGNTAPYLTAMQSLAEGLRTRSDDAIRIGIPTLHEVMGLNQVIDPLETHVVGLETPEHRRITLDQKPDDMYHARSIISVKFKRLIHKNHPLPNSPKDFIVPSDQMDLAVGLVLSHIANIMRGLGGTLNTATHVYTLEDVDALRAKFAELDIAVPEITLPPHGQPPQIRLLSK